MAWCLVKQRDTFTFGIALGYGLDDRGSRVRFPAGAGNFSLHHRVQNGSGAHPSSYPMGTGGSFPGDKAAGEDVVGGWRRLHNCEFHNLFASPYIIRVVRSWKMKIDVRYIRKL
jgi:hypothetical protein